MYAPDVQLIRQDGLVFCAKWLGKTVSVSLWKLPESSGSLVLLSEASAEMRSCHLEFDTHDGQTEAIGAHLMVGDATFNFDVKDVAPVDDFMQQVCRMDAAAEWLSASFPQGIEP